MKKMVLIFLGLVFCGVRTRLYQGQLLEECLELKKKRKTVCQLEKNNPAKLSDIRWGLYRSVRFSPKAISLASQSMNGRKKWLDRLKDKTKSAPLFFAVQASIWTGSHQGLPFWLIQKYRDMGLLQVLALSGQHVWALLFSLGILGRIILFFSRIRRGPMLNLCRRGLAPLTALFLFSLAPDQPSMLRTSLCAGVLFLVRNLPNQINALYILFLAVLGLIAAFPEFLHSMGFILSVTGILGVSMAGLCFQQGQVFRKNIWLVFWLMPVYAFFFSRWVSHLAIFQFGVGWLWDHVYLPLFFLSGILVILSPSFLAAPLTKLFEAGLNFWLDWEVSRPHFLPLLVYRPTVPEMLLFWLWLVVLALWNRSFILAKPKTFVHSASRIDLERRAQRE